MTSAAVAGAPEPVEARRTPREDTGVGHVNALDGMRGIAILMVFAHHLSGGIAYEFLWTHPVLKLFRLGWSGVDLFFVLSGFLITRILLDAKGKPNYVKNFYARRVLRIFPLYYGALLLLAALRAFFPGEAFYPTASDAWLWIYATNIVTAVRGPVFGMLDHFWSLAVEEHFYLVWPFLVLWLRSRTLLWLCASAWAFSLLVRVAIVSIGSDTSAAYVLTPARVDALATGAFISLLARERPLAALHRPALVLGAVCLTLFLGIVAVLRSGSPEHPLIATLGLTLLSGVFGAGLVLAQTSRILRGVLSIRTLRFFGKYSYGLYVWHPIVFMLTVHSGFARSIRGGRDLEHAVAAIAFAMLLTALATAASWLLLESRFLKLKKYFR